MPTGDIQKNRRDNKMTKRQTLNHIEKLEKELSKEKDIKRRVFLEATINIYCKKIGLESRYNEYR